MSGWPACYIGEPWIAGESDCWAFCRRVLRERFGVAVPPIGVDPHALRDVLGAFGGHPEREHWLPVPIAREGDLVLLGRALRPAHAGLWVDERGGAVLHSLEGIGVVLSRPADLRAAGWRIVEILRHASRVHHP